MVLLGERKSWLGQSTGEVMDKARVTHSCSKEDHTKTLCEFDHTEFAQLQRVCLVPQKRKVWGPPTQIRGVFIVPSTASTCTERRM